MSPFELARNGYIVKFCQFSQAVLVTVETADGDASWMAQVGLVRGRIDILPQRATDWPLPVWVTLGEVLSEGRVDRFVRQAATGTGHVRVIPQAGADDMWDLFDRRGCIVTALAALVITAGLSFGLGVLVGTPDTLGDYLDRQPECAVDGCDLKASARDRGLMVCHRHNREGVALND